jgi:hypothetical protein
MLNWTELPDKYGTTMTAHSGTWPELVERLRTVGTFPSKEKCPWVKLATFGTHKAPGTGSLRTNANLTSVYGIEGDYDGEAVTMTKAVELLESYGVRATLYPSPSNTAERPRWRVIAPLARQHTPAERAGLVARLNGVLNGILSGESFTLSQGYFFGGTPTNDYRVVDTFGDPTDGTCIDDLPQLEELAIFKNAPQVADGKSSDGKPPSIGEEMFEAAVQAKGRLLKTNDGRRDLLKKFIASRSARHTPAGDIRMMVKGIAAQYFDPADPTDEGNIDAIVKWAAERDYVPPMDLSGILPTATKAEQIDPITGEVISEPRYKLLTGTDLAALPPLSWRVRGVLPTLGLGAIYGPSGSGKSFLSFDLACAIAGGVHWFGCRTVASPVVYACLEGEAGLKLRAQAWEKHHGKPLPENLRVMVQGFKLTEPQDVADLAAVVPAGAVVFLDTLNRAAPTADENSSRDMGEILEAAKLLQRHTQGLVIPVHHTGKDAVRGMRGHSSLFAAMDGVIEVTRDSGDIRGWTNGKVKDGKDGEKFPFSLEVVPLGEDEYGDPIDSCVVQVEAASSNQPKSLTKSQAAAMTSYHKAAELYGILDAEGKYAGLHVDAWRPEFYRTHTADSIEAKQKAFQRVRRELVDLGRLILSDDVYRGTGGFEALLEESIRKKLTAAKLEKEQADIADTSGHCPDLSAAKTQKQADGQDISL